MKNLNIFGVHGKIRHFSCVCVCGGGGGGGGEAVRLTKNNIEGGLPKKWGLG